MRLDKKLLNIDVAIKYLNLCFNKIEKEDNIQCMKLFKNFMEIYGDEIREQIKEINNKKDILDILLKNFDNYVKLKEDQKKRKYRNTKKEAEKGKSIY